MQTQKNDQKIFSGTDEKILVLRREVLFPNGAINGLEVGDIRKYEEKILNNREFIWRSQAESDVNFKQIIPYMIFNFEDKFFLMQRRSKASEQRLQGMYTLGIGGHVREEDISGSTVLGWAQREFNEEIDYTGQFSAKAIGLINDESNFVGQVHTGLLVLLKGDSDKISVGSELEQGMLLSLEECKEFYTRMENWSKLVFDYLFSNSHSFKNLSNPTC